MNVEVQRDLARLGSVEKLSIGVDRNACQHSEFLKMTPRHALRKMANIRPTGSEPTADDLSADKLACTKLPKMLIHQELGARNSEPSTFNGSR